MDYSVKRGFCTSIECSQLTRLADDFIAKHYTRKNLYSRVAYPSDRSASRDSFAFILKIPGGDFINDLPGLASHDLPQMLFEITQKVIGQIGVREGRTLLNVQRYTAYCDPVIQHFDGEFFEYTENDSGKLHVVRGIRPEKVAVLTTINQAVDGGTTLIVEHTGESKLIRAAAGDLLCFDNANLLHGVESLNPRSDTNLDWYLRYIIGWRPFEDRCSFVEEGSVVRSLTAQEAAEVHRQFLLEEWPLKREEAVKVAPF